MCCPSNCFITTAELVSDSRGDYFLFMKMVNYSETLLLSKERNFMAISVATSHACAKCTKCPNVQMRVIVVWNQDQFPVKNLQVLNMCQLHEYNMRIKKSRAFPFFPNIDNNTHFTRSQLFFWLNYWLKTSYGFQKSSSDVIKLHFHASITFGKSSLFKVFRIEISRQICHQSNFEAVSSSAEHFFFYISNNTS